MGTFLSGSSSVGIITQGYGGLTEQQATAVVADLLRYRLRGHGRHESYKQSYEEYTLNACIIEVNGVPKSDVKGNIRVMFDKSDKVHIILERVSVGHSDVCLNVRVIRIE